MLGTLSISNYVIIEHTEIRFSGGLNMITGETGAGKSILLGAVGLVLGNRADTQVLYNPEEKAIVEAVFPDPEQQFAPMLTALDLDAGAEIVLRREIAPGGRSRAFVNDTPVTLNILSEIGSVLVDVHGQFETLDIQQTREQFNVLDAFCGILDNSERYQAAFLRFSEMERALLALRKQQSDAIKEKDYLTFQLQEFDAMPREPGGIQAMEEEFELQAGAEEIKAMLFEAVQILSGEEGMTDSLRDSVKRLAKHASGNQRIAQNVQRLQELVDLAQEASTEILHFADEIEPDPGRREQLEEKLNVLNRMMQKHAAKDEAELMQARDRLQAQLDKWTDLDSTVVSLESDIKKTRETLFSQAEQISRARRKGAGKLAQLVTSGLHELAMKHATLEIVITDTAALHLHGKDDVEFLFAPNLGSEPKPIRKVASGGELSRLNLCLKSAVSDQMELPTLIFDEIDTGVSGEVAKRMGQKLKQLSSRHQVIMITHSPQIAAQAGNHLQVSKAETHGRSIAYVRPLDTSERITEIAKMLSGDPPTNAALLNAKTLIETQ